MLRKPLLSAPSTFSNTRRRVVRAPVASSCLPLALSTLQPATTTAIETRRYQASVSCRTINANDYRSWWYAAVTATAIIGSNVWASQSSSSTTRCEEEVVEEEVEEEEEDPYDNLPEEDEPTHCSICLTYRQGPCRPYWRKVEACTKDNELKKDDQGGEETGNKEDDSGEEKPDPPCFKYMLPWIDCATGYRNLYSLIELDTNYTAGIADLEKEATMEMCWAPSAEPTVDWSAWQAYVASHPEWKMPQKKSSKKTESNQPKVALWKTLDNSRDPELVEILASVPSKQGEGVLECAYAVDQDGNVLGFSYGTKPSEVAKQATEDEQQDEQPAEVELKIRLLPLHTRNITLAAAYTQLPKEGDGEVDTPDSHVFKSRPFSLKKMAKV